MRNIFLLSITSLFADVAGDMIVPILPLFFTVDLGLPVALLGVLESFSDAVGILLRVVFGYASDRIHKRKVFVIFGYSTAMIGKFFLALANVWPLVLVARLLDRTGKGFRTAPRDALIASSVPAEKRASMYGFHRMMDTLGAVIGNIGAMVFLYFAFSHRSIFWISLIPAVIAILFLIPVRDHYTNQENHSYKERENGLQASGKSPEQRHQQITKFPGFRAFWSERKLLGSEFWRFTFVSAIFNLGNIGYSFLLLRAYSYGASEVMVPILYLVFNVFQAALSWPVGKVANRFGKEILLLIGFALFSLMSWGFAFESNLFYAFILFAMYGIFYAFNEVLSRSIVVDLVGADRRATGLGIYSTLMGVVLIPASLIGGLLWKFGAGNGTFLYSALITSLASVIYFVFFANKYLFKR